MADHVHRNSPVGKPVMLMKTWYKSVDVLSDLEVREGIKAFSNWPTIPQLYVKGEFVGGCDIVREMYQAGELATLLSSKGIEAATI
jgi:monothiol glutaredoxin